MKWSEKCLESSPCSTGEFSPDIRKPCQRRTGHSGPHRNHWWEWEAGDLEPRPRKDKQTYTQRKVLQRIVKECRSAAASCDPSGKDLIRSSAVHVIMRQLEAIAQEGLPKRRTPWNSMEQI